jgi:hypothetical protein
VPVSFTVTSTTANNDDGAAASDVVVAFPSHMVHLISAATSAMYQVLVPVVTIASSRVPFLVQETKVGRHA